MNPPDSRGVLLLYHPIHRNLPLFFIMHDNLFLREGNPIVPHQLIKNSLLLNVIGAVTSLLIQRPSGNQVVFLRSLHL
jgi:hypothetical protein